MYAPNLRVNCTFVVCKQLSECLHHGDRSGVNCTLVACKLQSQHPVGVPLLG